MKRQPLSICPDLETLASFVDRRLPGEGREPLLAHLSECERCQELVAEALHASASSGGSSAASDPSMATLPLQPTAAAPVARAGLLVAASVLAILVPLLVWTAARARLAPSERLLSELPRGERLATRLGEGWASGLGPTFRGAGPRLVGSVRARAFRVGVDVVDLAVALRARDRASARYLVEEVADLVEGDEDAVGASAEAQAYQELRATMDAGESDAEVSRQARKAERGVARLLPGPDLGTGRLLEAARLAARAGEAGFFGYRRRGQLAALARRAPGPASDLLREALAAAPDDLAQTAALLQQSMRELAAEPPRSAALAGRHALDARL